MWRRWFWFILGGCMGCDNNDMDGYDRVVDKTCELGEIKEYRPGISPGAPCTCTPVHGILNDFTRTRIVDKKCPVHGDLGELLKDSIDKVSEGKRFVSRDRCAEDAAGDPMIEFKSGAKRSEKCLRYD